MVGTFAFVCRGEVSVPIHGIWHRSRPERARWGQNNRSVSQPAEYFRGGAQAIRAFSEKYWTVCCRTTALLSPYRHL